MASQSRPEPMNASPYHSKVKVTLALSDPVYVSGANISGKMEVESRADLDSLLGIGMMMVELHAIQEVNSGDHSATSTFIHSRRIFQGPGLPPSNAVHPDYVPGTGEILLPAHHYPARRGLTTFFFQFPVPSSAPSSITFGPANIRYEIRASVSVAWRGEKCLVTDKREVKIVESWDSANATQLLQAMAFSEGGKIWAEATITNGPVIGGQPACIDLQLKNHSQRWTSGVTVTLTRHLHIAQSVLAGEPLPIISDVATQVEFRGPEYSVPPGIEGVSNLVIDIPRHARGVRGGLRIDDNGKTAESFFEVRCALEIRIDLPSGSEDTVISLPVTIYHSLAVPELPMSPLPLISSPYPYAAPISSGSPLPALPAAQLMSVYPGTQHPDPTWALPSMQSASIASRNQYLDQETHNWQGVPPTYASPMQRSTSAGPEPQEHYGPRVLSTSYTHSPRLLPPPPVPLPHPGYSHPVAPPLEQVSAYANLQVAQGIVTSPTSQNLYLNSFYPPLSPSAQHYPPLPLHAPFQAQPPTPNRVRPPPIQIPSLPNPHETQGLLHSPRPVPSPKQSFHGSIPKSDNVSELERMVDDVAKQMGDLCADTIPSKGDAGVEPRFLGSPIDLQQSDLSLDKTLPAPPVPSGKDRQRLPLRPRVETLFATVVQGNDDMSMSDVHGRVPSRSQSQSQSQSLQTDHDHDHGGPSHSHSHSQSHSCRSPPTPPIAAITPIKFPRAPTSLSGLGANLGKDIPPESGLDALERRLLAEVGTRKVVGVEERVRAHVRRVVKPIAIPPSGAPDGVNDSAISSLTLADREGILREDGNRDRDREQEQDLDSDERTQHFGGGHSPSEDDRDARTQKGKSIRKLGKSKHSEEDLERVGRRRERKKTKEGEGRKLRQEAKGRVAAWLGEIDISAPPITDEPSALISPSSSHFVPITESASFRPSPTDMAEECRPGDISMDKDVSAAPNPRSSGFVTISSLNTAGATKGSGKESGFKQPPRRSSANDFDPKPSPQQQQAPNKPSISRSPSAEVKRTEKKASPQLSSPRPQQRLFPPLFSRFPPRPTDPEAKYDVRSARGGRGGKVTQVASLWAAKATSIANASNAAPNTPAQPKKATIIPTPARKPVPNVLKRSPIVAMARNGPVGGVTTGRESREPSKATTVPAVISSSHAIPMLSSTASLARVQPANKTRSTNLPLPPMISEMVPEVKNLPKSPGLKSGPRQLGDLAFGQARLRDLIKKYQG